MVAIRIGAAATEAPPVPVRFAPANTGLLAGHFRLTASDGTTVDSDALARRPYGLFLGFTHRPDICPTTLAASSGALARLPAGAPPLSFVTVDPERDTADVPARYMTHVDPRIVALTGTRGAGERPRAEAPKG